MRESRGQSPSEPRLVMLVCAAFLMIGMGGCGSKKAEPAPPPQAPAAPSSPTPAAPDQAPAPPPPPPSDASLDGAAPKDAAPERSVDVGNLVPPGMREVLAKFFNDYQHPATSWKELMDLHYISSIPKGPDGKPLDWNKFSEAVAKSSRR